jgi:hypothetical protein
MTNTTQVPLAGENQADKIICTTCCQKTTRAKHCLNLAWREFLWPARLFSPPSSALRLHDLRALAHALRLLAGFTEDHTVRTCAVATLRSIEQGHYRVPIVATNATSIKPIFASLKWLPNLKRDLQAATAGKMCISEKKIDDCEELHPLIPHHKGDAYGDSGSTNDDLPQDLILGVSKGLPPASLAMHRVWSKFRHMLRPQASSEEYKHDDMTTAQQAQYNDVVLREPQAESQEQHNVRLLLSPDHFQDVYLSCSGCQAIHSVEHFSEQQLNNSPDPRVCKGLEGTVRLCSHLSFSAQCLLRGLDEMDNVRLMCTRGHYRDIHGYTAPGGYSRAGPRIEFHRELNTIIVDRSTVMLNF